VQVQQMLRPLKRSLLAPPLIPALASSIAFGLGGILVEVLQDITFRLAPADPVRKRFRCSTISPGQRCYAGCVEPWG